MQKRDNIYQHFKLIYIINKEPKPELNLTFAPLPPANNNFQKNDIYLITQN